MPQRSPPPAERDETLSPPPPFPFTRPLRRWSICHPLFPLFFFPSDRWPRSSSPPFLLKTSFFPLPLDYRSGFSPSSFLSETKQGSATSLSSDALFLTDGQPVDDRSRQTFSLAPRDNAEVDLYANLFPFSLQSSCWAPRLWGRLTRAGSFPLPLFFFCVKRKMQIKHSGLFFFFLRQAVRTAQNGSDHLL